VSLLRPDYYFRSVCDVDLDELCRQGVRLLLLDLDNTLVFRNTTQASPAVMAWIATAKARGLDICIVSNNWHERVHQAATDLGVRIVGKGTKPLSAGFKRAIAGTGLPFSASAVVGDQVFTDILGGNLVGATTVLVVPLAGGSDLPHTRVLRALERRILRDRMPSTRDAASAQAAPEGEGDQR
jgi:uncharacterized protein